MEKKPNKKEQIIDTALRVFAQKPYDGATLKEICEKMNMFPTQIYHYYDKKDGDPKEKIFVEMINKYKKIAWDSSPLIRALQNRDSLKALSKEDL